MDSVAVAFREEVIVGARIADIDQEKPQRPAQRVQFEALSREHMPADFEISLDAYRRGGTDNFIGRAPEALMPQPMEGFEDT